MKFCPNYKNKEVFDGFNEMVESFGGAPLSEEEFRSSELRNQRTGRDFSAMEATYMIYDKNNGNLIDRAPNGEPSILFQKYLEKHNGNRAAAIIEKSEIYSEDFVKKYGDWQNISTYERVEDIPNQIKSATDNNGEFSTENDDIRYHTKLDINGEPDLDVTPAKQKPSDNKSSEIL